jgi:hypothetical protein
VLQTKSETMKDEPSEDTKVLEAKNNFKKSAEY